jgi:hypothetical protein
LQEKVVIAALLGKGNLFQVVPFSFSIFWYTVSMIHTIVTPTRPQADTLVAIFIIKKYGNERFPGVNSAVVSIYPTPPEQGEEEIEKQGILLFDLGGGRFDHHGKNPVTTCSALIAEYLEISEDPTIKKLLDYAYRDDTEGKGTLSSDALDRAFGLSGLIGALNKQYENNPSRVIDIVLPLLEAHHTEEVKRFEVFPQEVKTLQENNKFQEVKVKQKNKTLNVALFESDNPGLPGFLRSQIGGRYDIVVQRRQTGHTNILTRPTKWPDIRRLAALIRYEELQYLPHIFHPYTLRELSPTGRMEYIPQWYFDPATNSLQNGGLHPGDIPPTNIAWESFIDICKKGLEF